MKLLASLLVLICSVEFAVAEGIAFENSSIRSGRGEQFRVLGKIPKYAHINIISCEKKEILNKRWCLVEWNKIRGYTNNFVLNTEEAWDCIRYSDGDCD